jgi:DNA adenine methylase
MTAHRRRPLVRWHGGKWKWAAWILAHLPPHAAYVEPFGGGASVLLQKEPALSECYNDLDDTLVALFRVLQDPEKAARLVWLLERTPFSRREFERAYQPADGDDVEAARRTLARSFMGIGSLGTTGAKTGFRRSITANKFPAREWATYPPALQLTIERLKDVVLESCDARDLIADLDAVDTLFYCDPPYLPHTRSAKSRRGGESYHTYRYELTVDEHVALLEQLKSLQGMVVLSGYPSELYDDILVDWERVERAAYAHGGIERVECLWLSPTTVAARAAEIERVRMADPQAKLFEGAI